MGIVPVWLPQFGVPIGSLPAILIVSLALTLGESIFEKEAIQTQLLEGASFLSQSYSKLLYRMQKGETFVLTEDLLNIGLYTALDICREIQKIQEKEGQKKILENTDDEAKALQKQLTKVQSDLDKNEEETETKGNLTKHQTTSVQNPRLKPRCRKIKKHLVQLTLKRTIYLRSQGLKSSNRWCLEALKPCG